MILGYSIEKKMEPMIKYWRSIGSQRLGRIVELAPSLLGMSLRENIEPKVGGLCDEMDKIRQYNLSRIKFCTN